MFKHYFKIAFRNIWASKRYSVINIIGLTIGLTASMLIFIWVWDEVSFNQFHEKKDRIGKLFSNLYYSDGHIDTWQNSPYPLSEVLQSEYPEVEAAFMVGNTSKLFSKGTQKFTERGYYVGRGFFETFTFPFIAGNHHYIFEDPSAVAISERLAEKFFGIGNANTAIGETLQMNGKTDFKVTGVFKTPPPQSTLQFDFVFDFQQNLKNNRWDREWSNFNHTMYVLVKEGISFEKVQNKLLTAFEDHMPGYKEDDKKTAYLQPFKESYLNTTFENGVVTGGRIEYVRILFFAALFLLFIACINFTNLATARASKRSKEIGIRKVAGAGQFSLIRQFMGEAVITTLIAIGLAIGLSELLLPQFRQITDKMIGFNYGSMHFWLGLGGITLLTVFLSGAYPSFFLSSLSIQNVLKKQSNLKLSGGGLRKLLVVFQFVLSMILIIGALVVSEQINFIQNKNLGLDRENVLYMGMHQDMFKNNSAFRHKLSNAPGIASFMQANQNPINVGNNTNSVNWKGKNEKDDFYFSVFQTDHNFINTMNVRLLEGRDFYADHPRDSVSFIINMAAAKAMGMEEPIGQNLQVWGGSNSPIIGVTEDFHFRSLHTEITPLILMYNPKNTGQLYVRTQPGETKTAIASLKKIHKQFAPAYPFEYRFLDESYAKLYKSETTTAKLARIFAFIAILISCMGLLGLTAFIAEQKTKEIGIRKVLGAKVVNIVALLSTDFLKLIIIALVIATPIAWWMMNNWLTQYAYAIEINWITLVLAGVVAIFIALLTISFQSIKAATANPINALKNE